MTLPVIAHDAEKPYSVSKLYANALYTCLRSSECLLKRNRDDLDSDDDDSGEEVLEPFSKSPILVKSLLNMLAN
jgi:hypothetical protein